MTDRTKYARLRIASSVCALVFVYGTGVLAQKASIPTAQIILFTPSDIKTPPSEKYLPRLHQIGLFAEQFFNDGLTQWGYTPKRKEIFNRGSDGMISVLHVTGDLPAAGGEYRKKWISRQVLGKLQSEHKIETAGNLFWIFVYIGDPPSKHDNYRGSGNSKDGGWAVLNYTNLPGTISLDREVAAGFHDKVFLKGCIHEFGHALGLPHIGPKVELRRGNSLMGPVTRAAPREAVQVTGRPLGHAEVDGRHKEVILRVDHCATWLDRRLTDVGQVLGTYAREHSPGFFAIAVGPHLDAARAQLLAIARNSKKSRTSEVLLR